jgi:hypothetical protein
MEHFMGQGWTDGLPIVPPTTARVRQFLEYAGRSPSEILGTEPTKGRVVTAEKVAVNAVMAGCLPEYFPIVLATVDAILEPEFNLHAITVSTMGAAVLLVVNGPIIAELVVNSGVSLFNVTGAIPGVLDKATLGHAGKYTWCIAEDEATSPWRPLHVARGLPADQSAVTAFAGLSPIQVTNHEGNDPESILSSFRDGMFAAGFGHREIVLVLGPEHVGYLKAAGWSKRQVRECLHEICRRPSAEWLETNGVQGGEPGPEDLDTVVESPDGITVIVGGGPAGGFSDVIPLWGGGSGSQSVIKQISPGGQIQPADV